jgi:hypothetical protein
VPVAYTSFDDIGARVKRRLVSEKREHAMREQAAHAGISHGDPVLSPGGD